MAWRSEGRVHLASDSRIKLGEARFADVGIKVIAVPVVVTDTGGPEDNGPSIAFQQTYGLAYAGSLVNAGTFCELIGELLQHVQFVHREIPLTFVTICDFLVDYSSRISTEICAYMERRGRYEFFFTGKCPNSGRLHAAKFQFAYEGGDAMASYREILTEDQQFDAIGSGVNTARQRVQAVDMRSMLLVLNEVIESREIESVGGDLQYGSFTRDGHFNIYGIVRRTMERVVHDGRVYGPEEQRIYKYRGFQIYDNWNPLELPLWVTPSLVELHVLPNAESTAQFRKRHGLPPE